MNRLKKGKVFLVGAGPGDPKLITVKGLDAIRRADAVVYDRLASPRLLKHMKPGAEPIYVGKLPDRHTMKQEEINQLLVDLALQGKTVTRLKGGDPSVFGRVGEEAELLIDHGVPFEIVPGITSAVAVPAYAGIPVTHRDLTSSFAVVTGHENPEKLDSTINWEKLSTATGTIIFLMGVAKIEHIRNQLVRCGRSADTPVALIRWGTTAEQQTLVGTLATIVEQVKEHDFQPPAIIIVGEVVSLREKLAWYEKKPLFGKRVLVTRSRSQSSELAEWIDDMGGEAIEFPVIHMRPPAQVHKLQELDDAIKSLPAFDWIIFTSVNGVEFFFTRMKALNVDVRSMHKAAIAAVGPKTAEALLERGIIADKLPAQYDAESLLQAIMPRLEAGQHVLLPRANLAGKLLPDKLHSIGLRVTEVDVYETVLLADNAEEVIDLLRSNQIDMITFTSSSTVTNLLEIIRQSGYPEPLELLRGIEVACIGPVTARAAADFGLQVTRVAEQATVESLAEALAASNDEF
jgi:uroporphyrinogen III methyltransferase/synthase